MAFGLSNGHVTDDVRSANLATAWLLVWVYLLSCYLWKCNMVTL